MALHVQDLKDKDGNLLQNRQHYTAWTAKSDYFALADLPMSGTCQGRTCKIRDQPVSAAKIVRDRSIVSSVKPKFDDRLLVNLHVL